MSDRRTLVYLADQACLTPHPWLATTAALDRPDQLAFDLDPPGDPAGETSEAKDTLRTVRHATRLVGELLDDLGLLSYVKTSGSRGFPVLVPLWREEGFQPLRSFAHSCAEYLVSRAPDLLTVEQRKEKRGGRVFIDVLRNAYGQTMVAPYAVRGRPGAPVSTPITWDELSRVAPGGHTMGSVRRRLAQRDGPLGRPAATCAEPRSSPAPVRSCPGSVRSPRDLCWCGR